MFENLQGKYFLKSKSINKKLMSEFIYLGIHKYKILSTFSLLQPQDTSIPIPITKILGPIVTSWHTLFYKDLQMYFQKEFALCS